MLSRRLRRRSNIKTALGYGPRYEILLASQTDCFNYKDLNHNAVKLKIEVLGRYRDLQLQVGDKLTYMRPNICKICILPPLSLPILTLQAWIYIVIFIHYKPRIAVAILDL